MRRCVSAQSSTCWMRCTWLAKLETISRCVARAEDVVEHRADAALGGDEAGHLGVRRVRRGAGRCRRSPRRAKAPRSVRTPSSGSWSILKSPVCTSDAGRGVHRDGERVGDRVVHRHELAVERPGQVVARRPRPRPASGSIRCSRSLAATSARVNRDPTSGMSPAAAAGRGSAPMWSSCPCVRIDGVDVVEPVLDDAEVGEDQVDAGLLGLGEQDAAVDDQQPAVELQHGHVAADLAEAAERHDAQAALGQGRRRLEVEVRLGDLPAHRGAPLIGRAPHGPSGSQVDAQLRDLLGRRVDQRGPHRPGRQAEVVQRGLHHDHALAAGRCRCRRAAGSRSPPGP